MAKHTTTHSHVQVELGLQYRPFNARMVSSEMWLHENGYHRYSAVVNNMRVKIEAAYNEAVMELEDIGS